MLRALFFCLDDNPLNLTSFSRQAGDFRFKLVAGSKILVTMAAKMVATWRVQNIANQSEFPFGQVRRFSRRQIKWELQNCLPAKI